MEIEIGERESERERWEEKEIDIEIYGKIKEEIG